MKVQMFTSFFADRPQIWRTCSMSPYPAIDDFAFFVFSPENVDLLRRTYPTTTYIYINFEVYIYIGRKKSKQGDHSSTAEKWLIGHACQLSGCISKQRREYWMLNKFVVIHSTSLYLVHISISPHNSQAPRAHTDMLDCRRYGPLFVLIMATMIVNGDTVNPMP